MLGLSCVMVVATGCVTETSAPTRGQLFGTDKLMNDTNGTSILNPRAILEANPRFVSQNASLRTVLTPLGEVSWDLMTYPLVSPNGQYIASETNIGPTPETIYGDVDSTVPTVTTITIYRITSAEAGVEGSTPTLEEVAVLERDAVLGRSCNERGFLIEAPKTDGSRAVGFVFWDTQEVTWVTTDGMVNAQAALGPAGRIAWARRQPLSLYFELVVRTESGMFTMGQELESWVFPTWSSDGTSLFAVRVKRDGEMTLNHFRGSTEEEMRASRREIVLTKRGSLRAAFAMMAGYPTVADLPSYPQPTCLFFHPEFGGVGIWRPLLMSKNAAQLLDPHSTVGVMDESGFIVFDAGGKLVGLPVTDVDNRVDLADGTQLPRRTSSPDWPYLLFSPTDGGTLEVVGMQLAPVN